jgi:hypothetical protein
VKLKTRDAVAFHDLGSALGDAGQIDESIAAYRQAIQIDPNYAEAHRNLGVTLLRAGQIAESTAATLDALRLKPEDAEAHWSYSINLLAQGDFVRGWPEYEWRWRRKTFTSPARNFSQPQWEGGNLKGRTILLHAEQGLGDTIQFVRYVPMVAERGGRVILNCQPGLERLFSQMPSIQQIVTTGEMPPFDVHCPLMSLPLAFKTNLTSIPASIPYLKTDPVLAKAWKDRLEPESTGYRIGLVWAGSAIHRRDRDRSIPLAQFATLAEVTNAVFFSLQKGPGSKDIPSSGLAIRDFTSEFSDFTDTAAFLDCLDLVITVDTAVAHLAGAMGKAAWVLLPFSPDWRWLLAREDSPWYPTMRLFRQRSLGDWSAPIGQLVEALRARISPTK